MQTCQGQSLHHFRMQLNKRWQKLNFPSYVYRQLVSLQCHLPDGFQFMPLTWFFFPQQFLIIFDILQCTFAYSRRNLVSPINSLPIMVLNVIRDQFSSTSVARSEKSRVLREIHMYAFCAIQLNTTLSTQLHNYPTRYEADMLRIISRMILCRGWEVFHGSPFTHDK